MVFKQIIAALHHIKRNFIVIYKIYIIIGNSTPSVQHSTIFWVPITRLRRTLLFKFCRFKIIIKSIGNNGNLSPKSSATSGICNALQNASGHRTGVTQHYFTLLFHFKHNVLWPLTLLWKHLTLIYWASKSRQSPHTAAKSSPHMIQWKKLLTPGHFLQNPCNNQCSGLGCCSDMPSQKPVERS